MTGQGTIVATGSIAYPPGLANIGAMIGAEKVMTMTSTYDHRIIQGAESGRFLARIEEYLAGRARLLRGRVRLARRAARPGAAARARCSRRLGGGRGGRRRRRRAPRRSARSCCRQCRRRARSSAASAATGTWPRAWTRSDSEPEGDPGLDPEPLGPDAGDPGADPGEDPATCTCPGATLADALPHLRETYCGTIAYEIEHIASHRQRVWLREHIESGAFRDALTNDESALAAASAWSRSTRWSASCTRPTSASTSSRSRAWT